MSNYILQNATRPLVDIQVKLKFVGIKTIKALVILKIMFLNVKGVRNLINVAEKGTTVCICMLDSGQLV